MDQKNLDEGIFFADKNKQKLFARSKDELQTKINDFLVKFKDYNPKSNGIRTDKIGRFFTEMTYTKKEASKDYSATGMIKKAIDVVKKVPSMIPKQETLTANSKSALSKKKNQLLIKYPDAKFSKEVEKDGIWSVTVVRSRTEKIQSSSSDRISNIQKQLSKLSDDQLKKIEDIVK